MNIPYIDTHCHLDLFPDIQNRVSAEDGYAIKTISVTNAPFVFKPNVNLFESTKNIRVGLGLHPELASQYANQINQFEELLPNTKYVGEIGLDGSSQHKQSFAIQKKLFEQILQQVSSRGPKILTIHSRNAAAETIDLLIKYLKNTSTKIILHWYSGDKASLIKALKHNMYFSINHKMISSENGRSIIKSLPIERILTETDAPFTFDQTIKTRISSLDTSINGIASIFNYENDNAGESIYQNFKEMLTSCN